MSYSMEKTEEQERRLSEVLDKLTAFCQENDVEIAACSCSDTCDFIQLNISTGTLNILSRSRSLPLFNAARKFNICSTVCPKCLRFTTGLPIFPQIPPNGHREMHILPQCPPKMKGQT